MIDKYELSLDDMKYIIQEFRNIIDNDLWGDIDERVYGLEYKIYHIDAIHYYRIRKERGGDCYCGIWEPYYVIDVDRIEIARIVDEYGNNYPEYVYQINNFINTNTL